jgi:hypothetical protein
MSTRKLIAFPDARRTSAFRSRGARSVHRLGLRVLPAGEGQYLARQLGGPLDRRQARFGGLQCACMILRTPSDHLESLLTIISRLLKSCAMPPVNRPTASIF